MIIKTVSRKSNVDQLIRYVLRDDKVRISEKELPTNQHQSYAVRLSAEDLHHLHSENVDARILKDFHDHDSDMSKFLDGHGNGQDALDAITIKHNVRGRSVKGYVKAFQENESLRLHRRKNNVQAYHTIISFSANDRAAIRPDMLRDIAREYISLRGNNSLFLGAVHHDRDHLHVHLIQSGTQYMTGIANRVSRQEFLQVTEKMQEYQRNKYPELEHSVHGNKEKNVVRSKEEIQNIKTAERTSGKTFLSEMLNAAMATSRSSADFYRQLAEAGVDTYQRAGKEAGFTYQGMKYRYSRLGVDAASIAELDVQRPNINSRLDELKSIRAGRQNLIKEKPPDEAAETDTERPDDSKEDETTNEPSRQEVLNQLSAIREEHLETEREDSEPEIEDDR